jgi:hypothetical protein
MEFNRNLRRSEALQEQIERFYIEKDKFDREGQRLREQGQRDQLDSE